MASYKDWLKKTNKQLMDMEIKDLRAAAKQLRDAANKRLKALSKAGLYSPAEGRLLSEGQDKVLAPKGGDEFAYRQQIRKLKTFLQAETTSVPKARELQNELLEQMGIDADVKDKKKYLSEYFTAYRKIFNSSDFERFGYGSKAVFEAVRAMANIEPKTADDWKKIFERVKDSFEQKKRNRFETDADIPDFDLSPKF